MLFPHPNQKPIQEQTDEEKLLLKEVINDQPKKVKKFEEDLFNHEPPAFTD
jgi:hypothetical protein